MDKDLFNRRVSVITGDITRLEVDAIVNAANHSLMGGGGVDGAIHRAAGSELKQACQRLRDTDWPDGLPDGEVALTDGFNLPARYVIHTVGPVYAKTKDKSHLLANCYRNALALADKHDCRSIAFPAISTGVYGYPFDEAAHIVIDTLEEALDAHDLQVTLCFFSDRDQQAFEAIAEQRA
ncbi:O-acetyl-ADP-ribose deacetylase (regulator of RNase III), contains Macro domain [Modicisalibacter muralis]|uniref:O-acetyl-ADP-ribose deacetylase (Regulator of RNase III), contains Macro domain n=1 Tax=Modicisalibacter muralis TaxID=119000 RepID=A0A1G9M5M8_9GAMM|nr:O-acetyl-ADP-ribose deacetylase [Halomonas muralis]SDL69498.1 O-acetyl-ADP-ribose deacetylase (regulator of RNase III), contains Macro domain [Halomonas muralis]